MKLRCVIGLLFLCSFSCFAGDEVSSRTQVAFTGTAPASDDKQRAIYEDNYVKMVAVGYGRASRPTEPGFYVFLKMTTSWIRIDKVSIQGATFGRSPTDEEAERAGVLPPSVGWNFHELSEKAYVEFPLKSSGVLFFPDKVESGKGEYLLYFNSGWEIEEVETILKLPLGQLTKKKSAQGSLGKGLGGCSLPRYKVVGCASSRSGVTDFELLNPI